MRKTKLSTFAIFGADIKSANTSDDLFSKEGRQALHECFWTKIEDGLELPVALRPATGDVESFFAETATYFANFTPITAYIRVFDDDSFDGLLRKFEDILPNLSDQEIRSAIGLALGELLTASLRGSKYRAESVSYGALRRTLSFAIYRSIALHRALSPHQVVERWLRIREIVGMESPREQAASISWITSLQSTGVSFKIEDEPRTYVAEVVCGRQSLSWLGEKLALSLGDVRPQVDAMRGPFDERSSAFNELVRAVRAKFPNGESGAIYIGFFCNEIFPGSFSHFRLLAPLIASYPTVLIWYGLFASLSEKFQWREAFSGLGLKMSRDLLQSFSLGRRPTCDIAFAELEVLSRLPLQTEVVKPVHPRACSVEIFPGVEVFFRFGGDDDSRAQASEQQENEEHAKRDRLLRSLLREALDLIPDGNLSTSTSFTPKRARRLRE